jgi:hypothetical protein
LQIKTGFRHRVLIRMDLTEPNLRRARMRLLFPPKLQPVEANDRRTFKFQ